jgi:hypothetical protein
MCIRIALQTTELSDVPCICDLRGEQYRGLAVYTSLPIDEALLTEESIHLMVLSFHSTAHHLQIHNVQMLL